MEGAASDVQVGLTLQDDVAVGRSSRQEESFGKVEGDASGKHFRLTPQDGVMSDHCYRQEGSSVSNMEDDATDECFGLPAAAWSALAIGSALRAAPCGARERGHGGPAVLPHALRRLVAFVAVRQRLGRPQHRCREAAAARAEDRACAYSWQQGILRRGRWPQARGVG
ncbi:unnamed protein product [Prorocentrum cordatum]|uniref:Uncharacterized protein n=1 Tax=Prorocentrum cordatum TaxID=2364126 RepID=A0ABN9T5L5_9DINO|nr:unnamed protein product [Polarella glacialis]